MAIPIPVLLSLVCAAPLVLRHPVGQGAWEKSHDPVRRRVSSMLAGEPVQAGDLVVVPLHARVPSEARTEGGPVWFGAAWGDAEPGGPGVEGRVVWEGRPYLRLLNLSAHPVLVPAGAMFRAGDTEVFAARDAVIPPDFAALVPAALGGAKPSVNGSLAPDGVASPLAAGVLLHGGIDFGSSIVARWALNGDAHFAALRERGAADRLHRRLQKRAMAFLAADDRTVVGAVFLVRGEAVAAHVFASHALFAAAFAPLCRGVVVQSRVDRTAAVGAAAQADALAAARGRAVAFLRTAVRTGGVRDESYGAGFEVLALDPVDTVVGHAVMDERQVVHHAAFYVVGAYWPDPAPGKRGPSPRRRPGPTRPPDTGGSETPPGVVDRKPRPSIAEARQRERRPGPPASGGGRPGRDR